jgi:hypothetical protein
MLGGYLDDLRHRVQDACQHAVHLVKQSSELHDHAKALTAEAEVARQEVRLRRLIREKITDGLLPRGTPMMIAAAPGDGSSACAACDGIVTSRTTLVTVLHATGVVRFDADCFELWHTEFVPGLADCPRT